MEAEVADRIEELNTKLNEVKSELAISKSENSDLHRRNEDFKEYNNELLDKLSDAELEKELVVEERDALFMQKQEVERECEEKKKIISTQKAEMESLTSQLENSVSKDTLQEEKYLLFKTLMDSFEKERKEMQAKNASLQMLLKNATTDLLYLSKRNESTQEALAQALHWEADIQPTPCKPNTFFS